MGGLPIGNQLPEKSIEQYLSYQHPSFVRMILVSIAYNRKDSLMKITASPETYAHGAEAVRLDIIGKAQQYAQECGVTPEYVGKLLQTFHSVDDKPAPCLLRTGTLHIAYINGVAMEQGILMDRLSGYLHITPSNGEEYDIVLQDGVPQHMFLVGVERIGSVDAKTSLPSRFWSYALVVPETEEGCPALAIALDCGNDEENITMQFSRRLYFRTIAMPGGRTMSENRLSTINGTTNVEAICATVAALHEFPIRDQRVNRPTREARQRAWQDARNARRTGGSMPVGVGATVGSQTDEDFSDPFADKS
jgi:hypothetical protein